MSSTIAIDVVHDVVCPWCYVGKRRLERALEQRPALLPTVRYLPFFLDPTVPPDGMPRADYIARKFGITGKLTPMHERLVGIGSELGIEFNFDRIEKQPNTLDVHRVIAWAQQAGSADPVVERLFALFFTEAADLSDRDVLVKAGTTGGLDADAVRADLAGSRDAELISRQAQAASEGGIGGVPFFVFAKRLALAGAHEPEVLLSAIDQAVAGDPPAAA